MASHFDTKEIRLLAVVATEKYKEGYGLQYLTASLYLTKNETLKWSPFSTIRLEQGGVGIGLPTSAYENHAALTYSPQTSISCKHLSVSCSWTDTAKQQLQNQMQALLDSI